MVTHNVIDIDTGKVVCTLPITSGGVCPTYRVRVVPVNAAEPLLALDEATPCALQCNFKQEGTCLLNECVE